MTPAMLLRLAAELRERAAAAAGPEQADLLFLAEEYEATACSGITDKVRPFSVKIPK